ncbi:MAG: iron-sulfur cluster assembly scaffold protein, partial [candidate division Zixibacteria bacterium]|nr:iron-sulfur cluster assembly scaffold protein [candidate division Zixibacteria bacterium]
MPYSEKVIDHFMNPRNMGEMEDASVVAEVGSPVCGDMMRLYLKIENDKIVDARFKTFGCAAAI